MPGGADLMLSVYLDVDGVLKGCASSKKDIENFLNFCLDHCVVFWLTSYCKGEVNYAPHTLENELSPALINRLKNSVTPTNWSFSKTEGINFDIPFIWFDDIPFEYIQSDLQKHKAEKSFFWVDKTNPESAKNMLIFLQKQLSKLS